MVYCGFWGVVCIDKWSRNFDLAIQSAFFPYFLLSTPFIFHNFAVFGTSEMAKSGHFSQFPVHGGQEGAKDGCASENM